MKVVKVRSPFIIQINEATQLGSKIELFIWNSGSSIPTTPTYTLSKPIPTSNQRLTSYNVSNFVKEYIDNIAPTYPSTIVQEDVVNWALFRVKRYWNNDGTFTLLDTTDYVGVNGFSNYMDGLQVATETRVMPLFNSEIKNNYQTKSTYPNGDTQYLNVFFDFTNLADQLDVVYSTIDGSAYDFTLSYDNLIGVLLFKIPITLVKINGNFINGCKVDITFTPQTGSVFNDDFYTYPICEPKYTPVLCDFINRFGGWQTLTLYKAQTNSLSVKNEDYKLSPKEVNYNPLRGQKKSFNFIGTQNIKTNTGWIDENYNELITDLLLSEKILIDNKPVILKTQGTELKTKLKNRLINYELEFEFAYNLINDAI
jgi:hypothetical protein